MGKSTELKTGKVLIDDLGQPWPKTLGEFATRLLSRFPILQAFEWWLNTCITEVRQTFEQNKEEAILAVHQTWAKKVSDINAYYEKLVAQLRDDIRHDPLTGLYNLPYILERLDQTLTMPDLGRVAALAKIDVRDFKFYNDRQGLGHHVGDEVLKAIASTMLTTTRQSSERAHPDICVRRSGDEFIIAMFDLSQMEEGYLIAQRFKEAVRDCVLTDVLNPEEAAIIATEQPIEADVGLAFLIFTHTEEEKSFRKQRHRQIANDWIIHADRAMYEGKKFQSSKVEPVILSINPNGSPGQTVTPHEAQSEGIL